MNKIRYYDNNNYQTDPNALQRYFDVFYFDKNKTE